MTSLLAEIMKRGGKGEIKTFIIKNNILLLTYLFSIFSFLRAAYKFLKAALESEMLTSWSDYPCQFFFVLPVLFRVVSFTLTLYPRFRQLLQSHRLVPSSCPSPSFVHFAWQARAGLTPWDSIHSDSLNSCFLPLEWVSDRHTVSIWISDLLRPFRYGGS